jgi:hypothetical protein
VSTDDLIARFEACTIANSEFHHREHVQVAWTYLQEMPFPEALCRFSKSLKRFAAHHGKTMLYHETVTCAYVALIQERIERAPDQSWDDFCRDNADLLTWTPSVLDRYYDRETLRSDLARRIFILPERR